MAIAEANQAIKEEKKKIRPRFFIPPIFFFFFFTQVTGIVGRADILACIFFLISLLVYHGYVNNQMLLI